MPGPIMVSICKRLTLVFGVFLLVCLNCSCRPEQSSDADVFQATTRRPATIEERKRSTLSSEYSTAAVTVPGVLTYLDQGSRFELLIRNTTTDCIAIRKYTWAYEIRLFDENGTQISDLDAFLETASVGGMGAHDWLVLLPGQFIGLRLNAYNSMPLMRDLGGAVKADCVYRDDLDLPPTSAELEWMDEVGARIARMAPTPEVLLP